VSCRTSTWKALHRAMQACHPSQVTTHQQELPCGVRILECDCDLLPFVIARLSGGDLVLVYEVAEHLLSADPMHTRRGRSRVAGRELEPAAAGPGRGAAARCCSGSGTRSAPAQVVLADDQHPVEQLRRKVPIRSSVRRRRSPTRRLQRAGENPDARCREHGVEGVSELPGTIPDQELGTSRTLAEIHQEVTRRLSCP
jgi:hypothetical protein